MEAGCRRWIRLHRPVVWLYPSRSSLYNSVSGHVAQPCNDLRETAALRKVAPEAMLCRLPALALMVSLAEKEDSLHKAIVRGTREDAERAGSLIRWNIPVECSCLCQDDVGPLSGTAACTADRYKCPPSTCVVKMFTSYPSIGSH